MTLIPISAHSVVELLHTFLTIFGFKVNFSKRKFIGIGFELALYDTNLRQGY